MTKSLSDDTALVAASGGDAGKDLVRRDEVRVIREGDVDVSPTVNSSGQHLEQSVVFHCVPDTGGVPELKIRF